MRRNVQLAGYNIPTPIQMYCLPAIMQGHDVMGIAQTGMSTLHYKDTATYVSGFTNTLQALEKPRPTSSRSSTT